MRDDNLKEKRLLAALWLSLIIACTPIAARAQSNPDIATLRGVHVVWLNVENMPDLAPFVDTAAIRLRVELKLREDGIEVRPETDHTGTQGIVYLQVGSVHASRNPTWALCTRVAFEQPVTIPRLPGVVSIAETWDGAGVTAIAGDDVLRDQVTASVDDAISEFLNAWLEANPKGAR